jgi:hypothetical protein
VAGALDALIAHGTYKASLARWHLNENGVERIEIYAEQ